MGAWVAALSLLAMTFSPAAFASGPTIAVSWAQLGASQTVSSAVYATDTVSGAVYRCTGSGSCAMNLTQGETYAVWGSATTSAAVYQAVYPTPVGAGSAATVQLPAVSHVPAGIETAAVTLPADVATSVSATVYSGTYGNPGPVDDGTLLVLTPSSGITLSAANGYGATVGGSVYAGTVSGAVYFDATASQSGSVTVNYDGSSIGSIPVSAAFFGGGGGGGGGGGAFLNANSVGPAGGTLTCPDGDLSADVPPGAVPAGDTLSCSSSTTAPTGAPPLPPDMVALGDYFTLSGANLSQPVTVTIDFNPSPLNGLSTNRISVFHDGAWQFMPTAVQSSQNSVRVSVSGSETIAVLADTQQFPDVPSGYWAKGYIDTLLGAGVIDGFPDGTFQPDGTLTRAQFVKMMVLTLGIAPGGGSVPFTDVQPSDWFAPYVEAAYAGGLTDGTSPTTFDPNGNVTREQMAVFLARALKLSGTTTLTYTDQSSIDPWALSGVEAATAAGYLNGFPDGTFQPLGSTTRAQASKVLSMVIAKEAPAG